VSIAYNVPGVKTGMHLNGTVLAKIFLGTISKWNDPAIKALNKKVSLPDTQITVNGGAFLANEQMTLYWDSTSKVAGGANADASGNFITHVKPFAGDAPGVHKLCASVQPYPCANFTLVAAAGARYRGRVAAWQIEPALDLAVFRGTVPDYLSMLHTARLALRTADPQALVVATCPPGLDLAYVKSAIARAGEDFDALVLLPRGKSAEETVEALTTIRSRIVTEPNPSRRNPRSSA